MNTIVESASDILDALNDVQKQAVAAPPGNLLILAGAGSGKTRVLAHRIAWLVQGQYVSPMNILSVTFTNKAAAEMRHRIESLLGGHTRGMWVGTFHSLAHRLLRLHWEEASLAQNFQILDSEDQLRLIKRTLKSLDLSKDQWPPKKIQWYINGKKDEALRPNDIHDNGEIYIRTLIQIYRAYEEACERAEVVDFAELLLRSYELLSRTPRLLEHYQQRFRHILVDEFQDTNTIQYAWLNLLKDKNNFLMIVGDDDQSIYGWRGAKIENIQKFSTDFPDVQTIRLEQNYRSSATILEAANALISHNEGRLGKNLWTADDKGEPITLYNAFNEQDEAHFIVTCIKEWVKDGNPLRSAAILYRSNAQSRVLEEALMHADLPYRIYGGMRFFERAEIKDALAYLRLIVNRNDNASLERVINMPARGIGASTLEKVRQLARSQDCSLWQAAEIIITTDALAARSRNAVSAFLTLINNLAEHIKDFEPAPQTEHVINASGLYEHYRSDKGEKAQARLENLQELVTAVRLFKGEEGTPPTLSAFLNHAALEAGDTQADPFADSVQLMTLHSAKGLEFPLVFLSGLEECLFPHQMSAGNPERIEEERRLCYVGITRAMRKLYITYSESRYVHGTENYHMPSRFIKEIPQHLLQTYRIKSSISRPKTASRQASWKESDELW